MDRKEDKLLDFIKTQIIGSEYENHVFLVGGAVRDELMGLPIKDVDLVIDLPNGGINFSEWICKKVGCYKPESNPVIYPTFGTAKFTLRYTEFNDIDVECVQTRKEQYHDESSRNPECCYGTLAEDCFRRDLTINALYKNICNDEILDLTGNGIIDIEKHIIRTPCDPDITYSDDPLRMLRAIRFSSRYGWNIESSTYNGIKNNAKKIEIITQERITDEINKILLTKKPSLGLKILKDSNLLELVLPEVFKLIGLKQNKFHFGDAWEHTLMVVDNSAPIIENRVAALFHDIGKIKTQTIDDKGNVHFYKHEFIGSKLAENILKRMKYSNDMIGKICFTIFNHMRTKPYGDNANAVSDKAIRKLQCDLGDNLDLVLDVINADNNAHSKEHCMPNQVKNIYKRIDSLKNPSFSGKIILPVNGDDIITIKNIKPSPIIKEILDVLKDKFLENPDITKEECIEIIKNY